MQRNAMVAGSLLQRQLAVLALGMVMILGLTWPAWVQAQQPATTLLLVARPQVQDSRFAESVVLVTRHGRSRPMGVILNQPTDVRFRLEGGGDADRAPTHTLYHGGPVSPRVTVYIFQPRPEDGSADRRNLLDIGHGLFLGMGSAVPDALLRRADGGLKVFRGFSSWAHGQLENEISRGDWLVLPFEPDYALRSDVSRLWQELIARASQRRT